MVTNLLLATWQSHRDVYGARGIGGYSWILLGVWEAMLRSTQLLDSHRLKTGLDDIEL